MRDAIDKMCVGGGKARTSMYNRTKLCIGRLDHNGRKRRGPQRKFSDGKSFVSSIVVAAPTTYYTKVFFFDFDSFSAGIFLLPPLIL